MAAHSTTRCGNLYLSALPDEAFNLLKPHLERTEMKIGDVIHQPDEPITHVYFPETAVISVVTLLEDGSNIETGIIGNEGIGGVGVILTEENSPRKADVQVSGSCLRIKSETFRNELKRDGEIDRLAKRFVFAFIEQISQNAVCFNRHRIEARLARWLLTLIDRTDGDELHITQEFIAEMLGAHRPTVTESAIKLQERGLIKYVRGHIRILDRQGLEETSCECYSVVKESYKKYLNGGNSRA